MDLVIGGWGKGKDASLASVPLPSPLNDYSLSVLELRCVW